MSDKSVQEILQRVDQLAAKLGVTAAHLWAVLMAQARVEAIQTVIECAVMSVFVSIYVLLVHRWLKADDNDFEAAFYDHGTPRALFIVFGGIVALVLSIAAMIDLCGLPTLLLNPEYWALKQLIH